MAEKTLNIEEKREKLVAKMENYTKNDVAVAFSGGADSALLLQYAVEAANRNGTRVYAVTVQTKLHPTGDLELAQRVAKESGAIHMAIFIDELQETGIENNPIDRCYRCKRGIFQKIKELAGERGVTTILEGTNADDLTHYRPGIKALRELNIISPLADCDLNKKEIRLLAGEKGISVANRPSMPCLATRLPYGAKLDYELLHKIELGEEEIRALGFYNVRLRAHDNIARIEVDEQDMEKLLKQRKTVLEAVKKQGFVYVTIDLEGFRSGSMDIVL